jgi:hypothetical protein
MEGEWSASRPSHFTRKERSTGTHWIGGWVGPRAVLDAVVKRKIPSPSLSIHLYLCFIFVRFGEWPTKEQNSVNSVRIHQPLWHFYANSNPMNITYKATIRPCHVSKCNHRATYSHSNKLPTSYFLRSILILSSHISPRLPMLQFSCSSSPSWLTSAAFISGYRPWVSSVAAQWLTHSFLLLHFKICHQTYPEFVYFILISHFIITTVASPFRKRHICSCSPYLFIYLFI